MGAPNRLTEPYEKVCGAWLVSSNLDLKFTRGQRAAMDDTETPEMVATQRPPEVIQSLPEWLRD
jgi:hypothetical protein